MVVDALSWKAELAAMSKIQGKLLTLIKEGMKHENLGKQLVSLAQQGNLRDFGLKLAFYTPRDDSSMFQNGET